MSPSHLFRFAILSSLAISLPAMAADPIRVVFQNGRSIPLDSILLQGTNLVVKTASEGFNQGQSLPLASADHIFGDKPAEVNPAISLILAGKPTEALKLLEPVITSQRASAQIPGNYWVEAARAALVAYALDGNSAKVTELGREISDATPVQGTDPFVSLGRVLLLPSSTKAADRETGFKDLTTDNQPVEVSAFASFFRGKLLRDLKREDEALEAFLSVPGLFPAGGLVVTAAAESAAADILAARNRRSEAVALFTSAARNAPGTALAADANKRLESLK